MIIYCAKCQHRVAYAKRPMLCSYCQCQLPANAIIETSPKAEREYKLSENDRRFLKSIRIQAEA